VWATVRLLFIRWMLMLWAGWAFLFGTGVLIARVGWGMERMPLLWGLFGLLPMAIAAGVIAYRRRPAVEVVGALLDGRNRCGGLLMVQGQYSLGPWSQRIGHLSVPRLCWDGRRFWGVAGVGALFVGGSFLLPDWFAVAAISKPLDISNDLAQLHEQIETLEEESLIEEQKGTELEEKLEQVRRDALGEDPVKTWEALDHLNKQVADTAAEAVESALKQTETQTQAQTLAQALDEEGGVLSPEQFGAAMTALHELMQQASAESQALRNALQSQASVDLASALTPGQLKALNEALKLSKMELRDQLGRLCEAKLCTSIALSDCDALGQCNSKGFCEFSMGQITVADCLKSWCSGGINRGRGDAEMTWNSVASSQEGVAFKEQVLPPATLAALKDSQVIGLGTGAPQLETGAGPSAFGALNAAAAGGGSAVSMTIYPRHRAAVQRYFEREAQ
jgi:hypothetical protein